MINDNKMCITREYVHKNMTHLIVIEMNVFLIRFIRTNIAELQHPNRGGFGVWYTYTINVILYVVCVLRWAMENIINEAYNSVVIDIIIITNHRDDDERVRMIYRIAILLKLRRFCGRQSIILLLLYFIKRKLLLPTRHLYSLIVFSFWADSSRRQFAGHFRCLCYGEACVMFENPVTTPRMQIVKIINVYTIRIYVFIFFVVYCNSHIFMKSYKMFNNKQYVFEEIIVNTKAQYRMSQQNRYLHP